MCECSLGSHDAAYCFKTGHHSSDGVYEDELLTLRTLVMIDEGGYGMSYISLDDWRLIVLSKV